MTKNATWYNQLEDIKRQVRSAIKLDQSGSKNRKDGLERYSYQELKMLEDINDKGKPRAWFDKAVLDSLRMDGLVYHSQRMDRWYLTGKGEEVLRKAMVANDNNNG